MISSTRADLGQYREEASKIIQKVATEKEKWVQLVEVSMEKETQSGDREFAVAVSKRWVEETDWVLVIVGFNYGTISNEAGVEGLSVTEWEYKHAIKHHKKVFVFIAGDPDTRNRYRFSEEEEEDLKDWVFKQGNDQKGKLDDFRRELSQRHAEMFANLKNFRERLEKTLKDTIEDLPPEFEPGTPLAGLAIAVQPNIRPCLRKVISIAACKTIHDHLHELRQTVISPLREEVLSLWKQEGTLSQTKVNAIWGYVIKCARVLGRLETAKRSIESDHQALANSVDAVLRHQPLWDIESDSLDSQGSRERFTDLVDEFAVKVQQAFSEADRSMTNEESNLRDFYSALRADLEKAQERQRLDLTDQQRLADEMEKIHSNRSRVKESLANHHSWQEVHDKLEVWDSFLESGHINRALNECSEIWLKRQLFLVEKELRRAAADKSGSVNVEQSADLASVRKVEPSAKSNGQVSIALVHDLQRLKESIEALMKESIEAEAYKAPRQSPDTDTSDRIRKIFVDTFDKMRKTFDDAFYCVDKRTLKEVERAQKRVESLEKWIDGLVITQGMKA